MNSFVRHCRFQPYKSKKNGLWYWRLIARNGKKIATGNESFKRRPTERDMMKLLNNLANARYDYIPKKKSNSK